MTVAAPSPATVEVGGAGGAREAGVRPRRRLWVFVALCFVGITALSALGVWQVERRAWKLDLISRVDRRVHAAPVPIPARDAWAKVDAVHDEYRHVRVRGHFLNGGETLVKAVTEFGGGFWVLTPLRTDDGVTVLINRGFVPADQRDPARRGAGSPSGVVTITGLLRITEPGGGFLRANDPSAGRWYSRDVAAIAAARGLKDTAPFFIDADATPNGGGWPVGGLTVVSFPNNHLLYAVTWFSLAAMLAGWAFYVVRDEWRSRKTRLNAGVEAGTGPCSKGLDLYARRTEPRC